MKKFEVKNLNIGYGSHILAKDLTFSLEKGEIMSVLGPNGVGKSTLLKTMLLLTNPLNNDSEIILEGKRITEYTNSERAKIISALFTERFPTGNLYVREVVELGLYPFTGYFGKLNDDEKNEVVKISKELEIDDFFDKPFGKLSDGQKQRVLLARALCQKPNVLILDEPFSYLDINYRLKISKYLIKKSHEENILIILSIQEPSEAYYISDKVLMLFDDGHFEYGNKEEMLTEDRLRKLYNVNDFEFDEKTKGFII